MATVLALDALSLIHRSYHAARIGLDDKQAPIDPRRMHTTFCNLVRRSLDAARPGYLLAAADCPEPTFRHQIDPAYKGTRKAPTADFLANLQRTLDALDHAGIPVLRQPGWEADDILATLASRMRDGHRLVLASSDRDLVALVSSSCHLLLLSHGAQVQLIGEQAAHTVFGVEPERVCQYKALVGDSSDNIPGVRGVGPKKALELLGRYRDLDALRADLDALPQGLQTKLRDGWSDLERSLKLACLSDQAPCQFDAAQAQLMPDTVQRLANAPIELPAVADDELASALGYA